MVWGKKQRKKGVTGRQWSTFLRTPWCAECGSDGEQYEPHISSVMQSFVPRPWCNVYALPANQSKKQAKY